MKIINIIESLDKGAVENWLVNIFIESRKLRPDWEWTFYSILGAEGRLDEKVRSAGGKIIYSPVTISNKISFLRNLRNVLKKERFDILHAHHDYLSGFYLLSSAGIKFRKRFLHVHNTDRALPVGNKVLHDFLLGPLRKVALMFSDKVIGISKNTLEEFANTEHVPNNKYVILYYGVNFHQFEAEYDKALLLKEFELTNDAKILLYAGRMNDLKNPDFVIDVLEELLKLRKDVYAVFIGDGDRLSTVKAKASALKIESHIRTYGWHNNVPEVMKCSDVFVFPRKEYPKEGLGIVVLEAQAAGLPMFITNGIVSDAIVIDDLAHFNTLDDPSKWAREISDVLDSAVPMSKKEALEKMKNSAFELGQATNNLIYLYEH